MGVLGCAYSLYLIDFEARQVKTILKTDHDPVRVVLASGWDAADPRPRRPLAVFAESGQGVIYLQDPERLVHVQVPPLVSLREGPMVASTDAGLYLRIQETVGFPETRDAVSVSRWYQQNRDRPKQHVLRLLQIDEAGTSRQVSSFQWTEPAQTGPAWQQLHRRIRRDLGVVSAPAIRWFLSYWYGAEHPNHVGRGFFYMPAAAAALDPLVLTSDTHGPANLLCAMGMATLALLHAWPRRTGWGRLAFWLVLVFAFNLAGLLTYLALNHTPVIRCPACGRRRGLLRPDCPACHLPLPPPEPRPTDLILPVV